MKSLDLDVNKIISDILSENTSTEDNQSNSSDPDNLGHDENEYGQSNEIEETTADIMFNNALRSAISAGFGAMHTVNQIRFTRNNK